MAVVKQEIHRLHSSLMIGEAVRMARTLISSRRLLRSAALMRCGSTQGTTTTTRRHRVTLLLISSAVPPIRFLASSKPDGAQKGRSGFRTYRPVPGHTRSLRLSKCDVIVMTEAWATIKRGAIEVVATT